MAITHFTRTMSLCTGFLLVLILPLSAAPESCISPDAYHAAFAKRFSNDVGQITVDIVLTGVQAERFLTAFNAVIPVTHFVADHIMVYRHGDKSPRLVALFQESCLVKDNFLTTKVYKRIMRRAGLSLPQHI